MQIFIILLLIWNLIRVFAFVSDVLLDPSTLDKIQQDFRANFPLWTKIVYGLAVGLGSFGTFGLFRRKIWSMKVLEFQ